jgi:hypothetical protein
MSGCFLFPHEVTMKLSMRVSICTGEGGPRALRVELPEDSLHVTPLYSEGRIRNWSEFPGCSKGVGWGELNWSNEACAQMVSSIQEHGLCLE